MERIPEPELMDEAEQAAAYARADFEEPHSRFIALLSEKLEALPATGFALDLGTVGRYRAAVCTGLCAVGDRRGRRGPGLAA